MTHHARPDSPDCPDCSDCADPNRARFAGDVLTPGYGDRRPATRGWVKTLVAAAISANNQSIFRHLLAVEETITRMGEIMATQADIDAIAAALQQEDSDLNAAVAGIQAEIAALQNQQPSLDLSGLQSQVDSMRTAVDSAAALVPAPAPAPADSGSGDGSGGN